MRILMRRRNKLWTYVSGAAFLLGFYFIYRNWYEFTSWTSDDDVLAVRKRRYIDYQRNEGSRSGPGEYGEPVILEGEEKKRADALMIKEAFNIVASDKIALDRAVRDVRDPKCKDIRYPKILPTASVVIIFHNEAWSPLLRTVHSVVNRSPPEYLHEVILLDDYSDRPELGEKLNKYVAETWPDGIVKIVRTDKRCGLIRARIEGAKPATGDVLIFLDSHCEAGPGWLEPLLSRIQQDRRNVLCPIVDAISDENLEFSRNGGYNVGGFTWSLHFTWRDVPEVDKKNRQYTDPVRSPTMAGGLFAIDREYFWEIGSYDSGMDVWGGENLEISFRIWMCGGRLEFIPCSRVGHIFRSSHPYTFPGNKDTHGINSMRLAEVWMDEYKRLFYVHRKDLLGKFPGDLTERKALREKLQCKSFKWYLDNVYPEKFVPDENVHAWGMMRNPSSNLCLDTLQRDEKMVFEMGIYHCQNGVSANQVFSYSLEGEVRREEGCLTTSGDEGAVVKLEPCSSSKSSHHWKHDKNTETIVHTDSGKCLDRSNIDSGKSIIVKACKKGADSQKWTFEHYLD